jgi:hypothetical protein
MKTKIKLLLATSCLFVATISKAQTWSHDAGQIRTGIPSGGLAGANAAKGSILFYDSTNTNTVNIQSGVTSTSYSMTLPTAQGVASTVLTNDGSGNLSWVNSGAANMYEASLSLSSIQILALNASPQTIVAAPGAGKYISVISATAEYTFVSTAYTGTPDPQLVLIAATSSNTIATNGLGSLQSLSSTITNFTLISGSYQNSTQMIANQPLQVFAMSTPTTGNGTLKIKVLYRIVTI